MDLIYRVTNSDQNIKETIKKQFSISSRLYIKLRNTKHIYLNKQDPYTNSKNPKIKQNDIIEIDLNFEEDNSNIKPIKMELDIIYEDKYLLIINKPKNMPAHPSFQHLEDSLSNGIKYYFDKKNIKRKIRIVNRLDKDTSGIVIIAKNEYIQESLIKQMGKNIFKKEYIGIVNRNIKRKKRNNQRTNCKKTKQHN